MVLALAAALSGNASVQARDGAGEQAQGSQYGQALYESHCAGCHGLDAHGGEHGPNIATAPRVQQLTDAVLVRIIRDGVPDAGMPAFARLSPEQQSAIAGYVRRLQGGRKTAALPGNADAGRNLFFNKAGCSECHMAAGNGGFIAGDLSSYAAGRSIEQIRQAILNPEDNLDPYHPLVTALTNKGQQYTGIVRNEDNFSMQLQTWDGEFHLLDKLTLTSIKREKQSWMPADYGTRISAAEINDLISYLMQIAAAQPKQASEIN